MPSPVAIGRPAPSVSTPGVPPHTPSSLLLRIRTWFRRPGLDAAIARGLSQADDRALVVREGQLVAERQRRLLAKRLEEVVAFSARPPAHSSRAPVDRRAVEIAAPVLADLVLLLRSPEEVEARGMAMGWRMLTDPGSSLYEADGPDPSGSERLWRESSAVLQALRPAGPMPLAPTPAIRRSSR